MPSQYVHSGNAIAYAILIEALVEAPYTVEELVKLSGLARNTTWKFIRALHRRRLIFVAVWRTDRWGRHTKPAYRLGSQSDVARPPPKTAAQRSLARRQREALHAVTRACDKVPSVGEEHERQRLGGTHAKGL